MKKYSVTFTLTLDDNSSHPDEWLQDNVWNCLESGELLEDFKVKRMIFEEPKTSQEELNRQMDSEPKFPSDLRS